MIDFARGTADEPIRIRGVRAPKPTVFIGRNDPARMIGWSGAFWAPFDGVDGQKFPPVMAPGLKLYAVCSG